MNFRVNLIACTVALSMCFTTVFSFAGEACQANTENSAEVAEAVATSVEEIIAEHNISSGEEVILQATGSDADSAVIVDTADVLIDIPVSVTDAVSLGDGIESVEMTLPDVVSDDVSAEVTDSGSIVYSDEESPVSLMVQPIEDEYFAGVRSAITIEDVSAPHEYRFEFDLKDGQRLVTSYDSIYEDVVAAGYSEAEAAEYAKMYDTGEVYIVGSEGDIQEIIDAAWAYDGNGDPVNTGYIIEESTLIQTVDFDENTVFPVIADPTLSQVLKCAAAIASVIVTSGLAVGQVLKIKKYVSALGGVKKAAQGIIQGIKAAQKTAKKYKSSQWWKYVNFAETQSQLGFSVGKLLCQLACDITGLSSIRKGCAF